MFEHVYTIRSTAFSVVAVALSVAALIVLAALVAALPSPAQTTSRDRTGRDRARRGEQRVTQPSSPPDGVGILSSRTRGEAARAGFARHWDRDRRLPDDGAGATCRARLCARRVTPRRLLQPGEQHTERRTRPRPRGRARGDLRPGVRRAAVHPDREGGHRVDLGGRHDGERRPRPRDDRLRRRGARAHYALHVRQGDTGRARRRRRAAPVLRATAALLRRDQSHVGGARDTRPFRSGRVRPCRQQSRGNRHPRLLRRLLRGTRPLLRSSTTTAYSSFWASARRLASRSRPPHSSPRCAGHT